VPLAIFVPFRPFEFQLPPGVSEFTVIRGNRVNFVGSTETTLEATVQSISESEARTTLIAAVVVVLAGLFYISPTMGHRWIAPQRRSGGCRVSTSVRRCLTIRPNPSGI
jgi:hypothetical protein